MKLNNTERVIVGGLVAVVNFLQLETSISHTWHIVIVAVSTFLTTVFVTKSEEPPAISIVPKDEIQDPQVHRATQ